MVFDRLNNQFTGHFIRAITPLYDIRQQVVRYIIIRTSEQHPIFFAFQIMVQEFFHLYSNLTHGGISAFICP